MRNFGQRGVDPTQILVRNLAQQAIVEEGDQKVEDRPKCGFGLPVFASFLLGDHEASNRLGEPDIFGERNGLGARRRTADARETCVQAFQAGVEPLE
jgi:hypothetical protein